MSLVIGEGMKFFDIPDEVLSKYALSSSRVNELKSKTEKRQGKKEEAEVEGYGYYYGWTYEGYGWYCDWWDAWKEER